MSVKKKNAPAQVSNPVGYGKPPVHTRFRKGKSGNPTGKRRHGEAERVEMLIRKEAYRPLTVREGDKVSRMPALQAVWRSLMTCAVKGNVSALRAVAKAVLDIEAKVQARSTGGTANIRSLRPRCCGWEAVSGHFSLAPKSRGRQEGKRDRT